ncbi:hypothetical protein [Sedimenticola selenatireducens]|uniref:Uncharacterized protein n=1 Tax=Sedimenticola selenatireducens TaxID=191960 RepID=A0A557SLZ1_9GAMM|nr:hypothetical protein [Sedimenticola selenatireducens]TVO78441.1 hypothetical protein FHP88_01885 [Sedimenticola selenatireducens]TVT62700.1 MAG: hypothetical protein FHK78_13570 [Sedimenticola selenatireducens]
MVQNSAGGRGYTSADGWLEVLYRVEECIPFMGTLPLMGELEMDTPDDGQHQITLGTDPFEITCHDAKIPQGLLTTVHPCEAGTGGLNDRSLSGAAHCDS